MIDAKKEILNFVKIWICRISLQHHIEFGVGKSNYLKRESIRELAATHNLKYESQIKIFSTTIIQLQITENLLNFKYGNIMLAFLRKKVNIQILKSEGPLGPDFHLEALQDSWLCSSCLWHVWSLPPSIWQTSMLDGWVYYAFQCVSLCVNAHTHTLDGCGCL